MGTFTKIDKRIIRILRELKKLREENNLMRKLVKDNPIKMHIPIKIKSDLKKQDINFIIECLENQSHNIFEFYNGDLIIAKLRKMAR